MPYKPALAQLGCWQPLSRLDIRWLWLTGPGSKGAYAELGLKLVGPSSFRPLAYELACYRTVNLYCGATESWGYVWWI